MNSIVDMKLSKAFRFNDPIEKSRAGWIPISKQKWRSSLPKNVNELEFEDAMKTIQTNGF